MGWFSHCIRYRYVHVLVGMLLCAVVASCGTGIEVTSHVTDKEVRRAMEQTHANQQDVMLEAYVDSLPAWRQGKRFWVTDDQVKLLFTPQPGYDTDTLHLAGRVLDYVGYQTSGLFQNDNRYIVVDLHDSVTGLTYACRAGKAIEANRRGFTIPMLIDLDMVDHVARQVEGKDYYILTGIWYDRQSEQMVDGRHFVKVHIDSVLPGNSVLPLRVLFTTADTGERAMIWLSDNASTMHGRDFEASFAATDPHLSYPAITDATWQLITRAQLSEGMTKEECRLSIGSPKRINENPDQGGMREYWYYDGGSYLYFVDGLLSQFRK